MEDVIRNKSSLLSHGDQASRQLVAELAEKTLRRLNSYEIIKSMMKLEGSVLSIGGKYWDLSKKRNIYLIGAGKAANHMGRAVDEVLKDWLTQGILIVKVLEESDRFYRTQVYVGGHPLPNQEGLNACNRILELVDSAGPQDLFICLVSGGSSALMSCPLDGITLEDEIQTTDVMLKSGAGIYEVNAIRRHISKMNGGMLAKRIGQTGAELIGIGISDAVGMPPTLDSSRPCLDYSSTPIGPDATTLEDCRQVIRDYHVADRLPKSVVAHLMSAGEEWETPKSFPNNTYYRINTQPDGARYAKEEAEKMGLPALILTSSLEGEARDAGTFLACVAKEIQRYGNPVPPPCIVISSGEVTTKIENSNLITGHGGPSQEMTLSFALSAVHVPGTALLSLDTEGTDGTTPVAGGLTDSQSYEQALHQNVDFYAALRGHACYEALQKVGDTVFTGNTGTNLCDLNLMYVPEIANKKEEKHEKGPN